MTDLAGSQVKADLTGSQVEKYQIIRKLAAGGFAEVYLGEHIFTKRPVAIKVLKGIVATGSKEDEEFKNEAITIAKLEHPHIIPLLDFGLTPDSRPYITMLLCETDLAKRIRGNILSLEQVLEYAVPIAQALSHAHQHRIVHRDVKPQNVLISHTGTLLLSDFGIAVKSTSDKVTLENIVGTAPYMAPEQFTGHARRATDQYALGIMVYEWLCGKRPFVGNHDLNKVMISYGHLHNNVDVPSFASNDVPTVDPQIEQAVRRALAKNPDDRFKTVLDFVGALEDVRTRLIRQAQEAREKARQQEAKAQRLKQQQYVNDLLEQIEQEKKHSTEVKEALVWEQEARRQAEKNNQELQLHLNELNVSLQNANQQVKTLTEQKAELEWLIQTMQKEKKGTSQPQPEWGEEQKQTLELSFWKWIPFWRPSRKELPTGTHDYEGYELFRQQRYEEALKAFEEALQLDSRNAYAHRSRGLVLRKLGKNEEALKAYEEALRLNPKYALAHNNRGNVLRELGKNEEALEAYEEALQLNAKDATIYYNKGNILEELGKNEEALKAYEEALRLNANYTLAHNNRGFVLAKLGKNEEALQAYEEALRLDPQNAFAHTRRGIILERVGKNEEALEAYEEALRLNPYYTLARNNRIEVLKKQKKR